MNLLLLGYYGKNNIGDDLFVHQLTRYLANQNTVSQISVFCEDDYYKFSHPKVHYLASRKLSKLKRLSIILSADRIAWGGGTLDIAGKPKSLLRLQALAKATGKPFCFLGIGLEGLTQEHDRTLSTLFQNADLLYLRDSQSYEFATQHFHATTNSYLGGDLAFLDLDLYQLFLKPASSSTLSNLSFCGKFWWGRERAEFYGHYLTQFIETFNVKLHLLPGHIGTDRNDNQFHKRLKPYLPQGHYQIHEWKEAKEFLSILSQMDFHIGNRLHSVIAADILGVANMGIGDPSSKIGHYIAKTGCLIPERTAKFMEPITPERVAAIFHHYHRPVAFIEQESRTAKIGVNKLFDRSHRVTLKASCI